MERRVPRGKGTLDLLTAVTRHPDSAVVVIAVSFVQGSKIPRTGGNRIGEGILQMIGIGFAVKGDRHAVNAAVRIIRGHRFVNGENLVLCHHRVGRRCTVSRTNGNALVGGEKLKRAEIGCRQRHGVRLTAGERDFGGITRSCAVGKGGFGFCRRRVVGEERRKLEHMQIDRRGVIVKIAHHRTCRVTVNDGGGQKCKRRQMNRFLGVSADDAECVTVCLTPSVAQRLPQSPCGGGITDGGKGGGQIENFFIGHVGGVLCRGVEQIQHGSVKRCQCQKGSRGLDSRSILVGQKILVFGDQLGLTFSCQNIGNTVKHLGGQNRVALSVLQKRQKSPEVVGKLGTNGIRHRARRIPHPLCAKQRFFCEQCGIGGGFCIVAAGGGEVGQTRDRIIIKSVGRIKERQGHRERRRVERGNRGRVKCLLRHHNLRGINDAEGHADSIAVLTAETCDCDRIFADGKGAKGEPCRTVCRGCGVVGGKLCARFIGKRCRVGNLRRRIGCANRSCRACGEGNLVGGQDQIGQGDVQKQGKRADGFAHSRAAAHTRGKVRAACHAGTRKADGSQPP